MRSFVGWFGVCIQPDRRNRCFSDATRLFSSRMAGEHDSVVSLGTNEVCIASIHLHLPFTFCNVSVCFCSYVTCSFMIETMAIGNAVSLLERPQNPAANHDNSEARPLLGKIAINFLVFIRSFEKYNVIVSCYKPNTIFQIPQKITNNSLSK